MKSKFLFSLTAVWIAAGISLLTAAEPVRDLKDLANLETKVQLVAKNAMPATVALVSEQTQSSGSGVIATADGLILTAAHVVQGADELDVVFPNGEEVRGKVLGANYSKDIAMVQIERKGPWPHAGMGASKPLVAGDWVVAMGHSAGFDAARTPPVRFGRVISKGPGNFLTTDCTLIGGDSGGPLFDLDGNIVGINSSIGRSLTNNNHAGVDGFKQDWDRLRAGETWGRLSMTPFANPEMPVLGIGMGMGGRANGVPVESIIPNSPSAAAGIRMGDVVKTFDGVVVSDGAKLLQLVAKRQAGDKVKLGISRDGRPLDITVTLARRNSLFEEP
jgi:serine protease Do